MKKPITVGSTVQITATLEQLHQMGMENDKINNNLLKFESQVTDVLAKASFPVSEDGTERCRVFIVNGSLTIPECYLKDVTDKSEEEKEPEKEKITEIKEETIVEEKHEDNTEKENEEDKLV